MTILAKLCIKGIKIEVDLLDSFDMEANDIMRERESRFKDFKINIALTLIGGGWWQHGLLRFAKIMIGQGVGLFRFWQKYSGMWPHRRSASGNRCSNWEGITKWHRCNGEVVGISVYLVTLATPISLGLVNWWPWQGRQRVGPTRCGLALAYSPTSVVVGPCPTL